MKVCVCFVSCCLVSDVVRFLIGTPGNHALPAYSIQAHPALVSDEERNGMYLTYTKSDEGGYSTPLVYVEWEE